MSKKISVFSYFFDFILYRIRLVLLTMDSAKYFPMSEIILASSSPFRANLLSTLGLPFTALSPDVDETPLGNENIEEYVGRLALEKAVKIADSRADKLVIGSDQACALNGLILGKPESKEAARQQLKLCSGNWVRFHTGLALVRKGASSLQEKEVETFDVRFRKLTEQEILGYLEKEDVLGCAGAFKAESLGICLFEEMQGRDFNTLVGLPLIRLAKMLRKAGINPLLS